MTKKTRITEMHLIITEYEWGKLEIECDFTDGDMLSEEVHNALWSKIKEVEDNWNKKNDAEEYNPNPTPQCEGRIMIDLNDACKWLAANVRRYASLEFLPESDYPQGDVEVESLLKAFKQAMEGGEE